MGDIKKKERSTKASRSFLTYKTPSEDMKHRVFLSQREADTTRYF